MACRCRSGALNAYTRALELDEGLAAALANRAACHLQLGGAQACAEDCSAALELLAPLRGRLSGGGMAPDEFERCVGGTASLARLAQMARLARLARLAHGWRSAAASGAQALSLLDCWARCERMVAMG
jgi:hypothetical protein